MKTFYSMMFSIACASAALGGLAADSTPESTSVTIQSIATATRGFPCVLKVTVRGPAYVPNACLGDELASIRLRFTSVASGEIYRVASSRGMDTTITTPEGVRRDDLAERMWQVAVKEGEQRSILLDVASLRPELGRGYLFHDVPPGEYEVTAEFALSGNPSNTIRMRIVPPTAEEEAFLTDLRSRGAFVRGQAILWSRVLGSGVRLPSDKWDRLSPTTKEQTAFHRLLADLNALDKKLGPDDENTIKTTPLPKFLEPERECLLHEATIATGKSDEAEASRLVKQYPDLEWRLQEIKTGKKDFLRYKKATADKGKP